MRRTRSRQARVDHADGDAARSLPAAGPPAHGGLARTLAAIARTAARLCEARDAQIFLLEGGALVLAAKLGHVPTTRKAGEPFPLGRDTVFGRAVIDRRPIHVRDMAVAARSTFPAVRRRQLATGVRTMLATPLLQDGRAVGAIVIRRTRVQPFTARQVALLATFADQAAIAIDHARVSAELAARNAELEARNRELGEALEQQTATAEILRVISRSPTAIEPVLRAVADSAARLCDATDAQIYRLEDGRLQVAMSRGPLPPTRISAPASRRWVTGRAVVDRRTVHVLDLAADVDTEFPESRDLQTRDGARTTLATPLLREGAAIGAILIRRTEVRPFTGKQIALLETFADQAAIAIENARLFSELEASNRALQARHRELSEALEQQTATAEILGVISRSPTDLQPVLETLVESATRVCAAYDATIFRREGNTLQVVAHHGPIPVDVGLEVPLLMGTVGGRALLERRAVHVADLQVEQEEFPEGSRLARELGHHTIVSVPLLRDDASLGVISLRRTEVWPFTDRQIALLQAFAAQAVIAIENVRLFTELEARNRELSKALEQQTATAEILRAISSSPTDIQPVLDVVARSSARLCEARDAAVLLREGDALRRAAAVGPLPAAVDTGALTQLGRGWVTGRAVLDRTPVQVADLAAAGDEFPEGRTLALRAGHRTTLAVPLLREGEAIGAILIRRGEVRPFSDAHIALLQTFADQAVIAIENVRLFRELEARNRELSEALEQQTATAEILRVISSSPTDIQPVLDVVARNSARLCEALDAAVLLREGGMLHPVASVGPLPAPIGLTITRGWVTGRAVLDREPVHVADLGAAGDDFPQGQIYALQAGHRTTVSVPLLREGEAIGAITIRRAEVRPFSDAHIALLQTFADQAVIAIENVRLFTELGARNQELSEALEQQTATAEILRVISGSPTDLQPVMDAVAENACRVCGAEDAIILRIEESAVRRVAHFGSLPTQMPDLSPIGRDTPYGRAIVERRTIHIEDVLPLLETEYPGIRHLASAVGPGTRLVAPLMREGSPIGAILIRRTQVRPFSDKQVALLETFAAQAVIAIENVRLFRELEARNRELSEALEQQTATAEILRVISSSPTDVQPVLATIVRNAVRLCDALFSAVFRFDGERLHLDAQHNFTAEVLEITDRLYPARPSREIAVGRAVLDRAVVHIQDALSDPEYHSGLRAGWRSMVAVPMFREGTLVGVLWVARAAAGPFSGSQIDLLQTFAAQAVIAIDNVRLFTDLRARTGELTRSVQQLTALGEVGQAVGSTLDLETVLETIASRAAQLAGADACTVSEYDEESETFAQRGVHNLPEEIAKATRARRIQKGEGAMGRLPLTGEPAQVADIGAPGAYHGPLRDPLLRAGMRALLAMPLFRETHLVGALTVLRSTPGEFPPETVELLRTFATQSAIAIQNARLFREIEAKGRQLEVASQHKSQFLANMSHELRTPLNAILGYTELIGDGIYGEIPDRMREVLERVDASGRHLLGLINDILDLSKIEAGQLRLVLGDYAMADVVQSVAASAEPLAAAKSLDLAVSMAPDLPAGWGDGRRLTQVLLNLVGNAIKFTDAGRVAVRAEAAGDAFVVSVTDTGPGIAEGEQERIFEEFQQAETTIRRAKGGTGLGLAISRRIVEMHGGRLWVESALGQGSTFTFTVPFRSEVRAATAEPAA